jgi:hypothetical protein
MDTLLFSSGSGDECAPARVRKTAVQGLVKRQASTECAVEFNVLQTIKRPLQFTLRKCIGDSELTSRPLKKPIQ